MSDHLDLAKEIIAARKTRKVVNTRLSTNERVIARVTDGIYRQPGSALRELISNAYDADATEVFIDTDAPRFEKLSISDNGMGMSPQVVAYLLRNIGGSSKRTTVGEDLGVSKSNDASLSPGGRRLIGKIGIGLFSVAQLTQTFQIITKIAGEAHRTIATVTLRTYSDDSSAKDSDEFETGLVAIWSEPAKDKRAHGTSIILSGIRPQARDVLRSRDIWSALERSIDETEAGKATLEPPQFHIGEVDPSSGETIRHTASLPWARRDAADDRFKKLVDSVWEKGRELYSTPKLKDLFDYYLQMAWNLGLAAPLPYVEIHPFDAPHSEVGKAFLLSNLPNGAARPLLLKKTQTLREAVKLRDSDAQDFKVMIDGLTLQRPLRFLRLPATEHAIKRPLIFVGKCAERFVGLPRELTGGALEFEAYLIWTPKLVPREHRGVLVRVNGASGTLFDETFMRYQTAEITRLSQISAEIFVHKGLDGALNIDRESFNFAHPHYVYLSKWLHSSLRQLATAHKKYASTLRLARLSQHADDAVSRVRKVVEREWAYINTDEASPAPEVTFRTGPELRAVPGYVLDRETVIQPFIRERGTQGEARDRIVEEKIKAIAQVLAAYGLLDEVPKTKRDRLMAAIAEILTMDGDA